MADSAFDCDVLVVGLGPVGAALAALLARRGVSVIAVERDTEIYPLPRAVHFDHEIMRLFQQLGVADEVARHSVALPPYEFRNAAGQLLMSFPPDYEAPCGWASGYMFHQPTLERALRDILATEKTADVRIGWSFGGLAPDADGVTVRLSSPEGPAELRARYLVGCDGGSSPVRRAVGVGLFDYGFDEPWLVVDVKVQPGARTPGVNLQLCDPERPTTCVLSGPGRHRWEFMLLPGETAEKVLRDGFVETLIAPWDCGPVEIERRAVYRFHGLVAERWRVGRVLLTGDAAHQTPPFAGQGMCSGLRDAANLAWKLDAVLAGQADPALLDTYQPEREPHARSLIELAIGMGRMVCTLDKAAAAARDRDMLARIAAGAPPLPPLRPAPLTVGCVLAGSPGAGEIFPQPTRGQGHRRLRLDDGLGEGPWLISRRPADGAAGIALHHLGDPALAAFAGDLRAWLDAHDRAEAVLVRPDRYVFGTGDPATLTAAWASAFLPERNAALTPA
jgi:3-(3-hydroxy-phenyl)propionate hydroxylase